MERVDYQDTFIAVAEDCRAAAGTSPPVKADKPSVAARTYAMLAGHPYEHTSGDVLFTVFADRTGIPAAEREAARSEFFARPQACLRSSDLGKRYGWGIHADARGRLALYGVDTDEYADFAAGRRRTATGDPVTVVRAMRTSRRP